MSQFVCKLRRDTNRVKNVAIHRCIDDGYGLIQIFTEKIRIPQEIVACLSEGWGVSAFLEKTVTEMYGSTILALRGVGWGQISRKKALLMAPYL